MLEGRQKSPFAPVTNNLLRVPGRSGAHIQSSTTDVLYINQPIGFIVEDDEDALHKMDKLAEWLLTDEPVELQFSDEPGRTYYAKLEGDVPNFSRFANQRRGTITFLCADPFSYGQEKTLHFPSDQVAITNEGTAEADPIFELTATQKTTFAMISNQNEEYNLIGKPADEDIQVVEQNVLVYDSNGEDVNEWSTSPVNIDDINNQIVSGEMGFDGTGFIATDYGTGDYGHGPAIIRELPSALSDFEVEVIFDTRDEDVIENFRTELYLFSEGMDMIGKLGVNDNTASLARRRAHGRVGEHTALSDPRYAISPNDFQYDDMGLATFFMRMIRIQGRFTFYIARIDSRGRHVQSLTRSYVASENDSSVLGNLKHIQLYIRTFDNRPVSLARVNRVRVYERINVQQDQTPYILDVGDKLIFDHKNEDILVNGEVRPDLMTYIGADFFKLKKGENSLVVRPENSFETLAKFRERFK